jgi:hypothetical protein
MAIIRDGLIVQHGTPREAVDAMRGKVWEKVVPRALLEKYRSRLPVISANAAIDGIRLRALSEGDPASVYSAGDGFVAVEPNLEDVYFSFVTAPESQSHLAGSGADSRVGSGSSFGR